MYYEALLLTLMALHKEPSFKLLFMGLGLHACSGHTLLPCA